MKSKDIDILKKRIRTLEARLVGINEKWSCYHEINQEYNSLKRVLEFIEANFRQKKSLREIRGFSKFPTTKLLSSNNLA